MRANSESLQDLLKNEMIRQVGADEKEERRLMLSAARDLKAAKDIISIGSLDWTLVITYNAMLSAGRALMLSKGYAPRSESHHVAVVKFCAATLPQSVSYLVLKFNKYRARRHKVIYEEVGSVGEMEAREALRISEEFVREIGDRLKLPPVPA
jgi:uncharacterized protein (UPF0332 family)